MPSLFPTKQVLETLRQHYLRRIRARTRPSMVTVNGVRLSLAASWATPILRQFIYEELYEKDERAILENTLRPEDRYLELGAGIGYMAVCACRLLTSGTAVVYEANPRLVGVIQHTAATNGVSPAVVNAVLGDADGEADFYLHRDFWVSSLAPVDGATKIRVPMRSFDRELRDLQPTYLMIDIEGSEVELLGPHDIPASVRAICVELHPEVVGERPIQDLIVKLLTDGFALDTHNTRGSTAFFSRAA